MTASKSFIEVGIPPRGPISSPSAIFLSIFFASAIAVSSATYKKALVLLFVSFILFKENWVNSKADISLLDSNFFISVTELYNILSYDII